LLGLGYYIGARSNNVLQPPLNPVYGTPEEFARAIEELRASFAAGEAVTTAPDQLAAHGFSPNSHHPGTTNGLVF
jgi:D-lactate dehydrogenase (cytochrome)